MYRDMDQIHETIEAETEIADWKTGREKDAQ
jgi:hypothetical protein